ncbi:O-antigen ligase family protein [Ilumatobacter coccineus]|uniref:O-antigen ligase-related domain-containing protein n=1 Tax=Ilumatobacter coccineus (strain NBRC 103263 / KCTC 29153 / YM16-304) TaxID=1313172 RepID=A0A6C7EAW1_ILUCY|nr:O-antigen ligase family protein [Ilumatobacter coccineus]BAN01768.1 hypothetical protein YM304_14540 [Ilumatobacter coccineus YM16-304]
MIATSVRRRASDVVGRVLSSQQLSFLIAYGALLFVGLFVAGISWKRSYQPYLGISLALLLCIWVAWFVRPRLGLALTVFCALIGDAVTVSWFPFNKNMSSPESLLFIADGLTISPLEMTLGVAVVAVGLHGLAERGRPFESSPLIRPLAVFVAAVVFGFLNGIARGGDLRAAVFEVRPLLYFPVVYLLAANVCRDARDFRRVFYLALAAITIQSLLSIEYLLRQPAFVRENLETLTEHGSSIGMNLIAIVLLTSLTIRSCSTRLRWLLFLAAIPVTVIYLLSQRRAAFIGFAVALILLCVVLFWRQRNTFWKVVPALAVVALGYVGAFWNSDTTIGFPAQAVKTVIAPDQLSEKDQSSDIYRVIENIDLHATIRSSPITGLGFGQKFLRPIPLPDISAFEFNEYIPHNSFLWIWIKTGFAGFVTLLYVMARSISLGMSRVRRQRRGDDLAITVGALAFVVMYSIFVYVDIAWEPRNAVLFGTALALCTSQLKRSEVENPASEIGTPVAEADREMSSQSR